LERDRAEGSNVDYDVREVGWFASPVRLGVQAKVSAAVFATANSRGRVSFWEYGAGPDPADVLLFSYPLNGGPGTPLEHFVVPLRGDLGTAKTHRVPHRTPGMGYLGVESGCPTVSNEETPGRALSLEKWKCNPRHLFDVFSDYRVRRSALQARLRSLVRGKAALTTPLTTPAAGENRSLRSRGPPPEPVADVLFDRKRRRTS